MGFVKRLLEDEDSRFGAAQRIAIDAGVLSQCEVCDAVVDLHPGDYKAAYELGVSLLDQGNELLTKIFEGDRFLLRDTIRSAIDNADTICHCERVLDED